MMNKLSEGLKPCPFCGYKEPEMVRENIPIQFGPIRNYIRYYVKCPRCLVEMKKYSDSSIEARNLWNRRVTNEPIFENPLVDDDNPNWRAANPEKYGIKR